MHGLLSVKYADGAFLYVFTGFIHSKIVCFSSNTVHKPTNLH